MARKIEELEVRVEGGRSSQFPIDMLRYDRGFPRTEADAHEVAREYAGPDDPPRRTVDIVVTGNGAPTARRWESFGWRVTHIREHGEWVPYYAQRVWK